MAEAPDSLSSKSYAEIIDLISEGEIEGFATPSRLGYTRDGALWNIAMLKDVFLNNTQLLRSTASDAAPVDTDFNFKNVTIAPRYGRQDQAAIVLPGGTGAISNEVGVNLPLEQSYPLVRTITDVTVDQVRITITIPALQEYKTNGDIVGSSVQIAVDVQYSGGAYTEFINDTITGRTSNQYQRDYMVTFDATRTYPINIRVRRITADSTSSQVSNATQWTSYTEITSQTLTYPNSALVGLRIDAEQFSSIPSRAYRVRGIKIKIPSNGTVNATTGAISYAGTWDGMFKESKAWTSDPAWVLYAMLTDTRFGFGDFIKEANLDKWAFYAASQYCGASVPDGFGGTEPRFSCNALIQTQEEAFKVINDLCSVFRATPFWSAGSLTIRQDQPTTSSYLFTLANVSEEGFTYSGSDNKVRPTVAVVSYLDLNTREIAYEQVEDAAAITKYGVITTQLSAFACTSRGQAHRIGEWVLYDSTYATEVVSFTTAVGEGQLVRPGSVIEIADPVRAGSRRGGRIKSATATVITVDDYTGLPSSGGTFSVIMPDGTVESKTVTSRTNGAITLSSALSTTPNANSVWVWSTSTLATSLWRVISVQEQDGTDYVINALSYNPSKYDYVERNVPLDVRAVTDLTLRPDAPTNLVVTETLYTYQSEARAKAVFNWTAVTEAQSYQVRWRKDSGNWNWEETTSAYYEILNITPGTFEIEIKSVNAFAITSATPLTGSITAVGKTAPPADVTEFTTILDPDIGVTLSWNAVADLDLQGYEIWQGSAFGTGTYVGLFAATSKKIGLIPTGTTTWWIKALDTSGNYSTAATSVSLTIAAAGAPATNGSFVGNTFVFDWSDVNGSLTTEYYEIRYGTTSSTWATATKLATAKTSIYSTTATWIGTRRFFVAAIDLKGNYGTANFYDAIINAPSVPTGITAQVIDNNVLLQWNASTGTLPVTAYEIRKGSVYSTATVIGTKSGQFTTVFETTSGTYTYWVTAIDAAGNYGANGSVKAAVAAPPDYVLQSLINSTFNGTKTNFVAESGTLVGHIDPTETWQSHFSSRSWTTMQDAINAGYTIYAQPSTTTGSYVETVDYGTTLAASKVTATLNSTQVSGTTTITPKISVSTNNTTWTDYAGQSSVYATNFRYAKVTYDFSGSGGDDIVRINGLTIKLDNKLISDAGTASVLATDSGGTQINFNVPFVDVDSITVTPKGTTQLTAVYDFVDAPNPTGFKVLVFNSSGSRVSCDVSWSAKGA